MAKDPLIELGEIFKKARIQMGFSLEDLADRCKIAVHHIENIEKARRPELPEEAYLMGFFNKIAKTLKIKNPSRLIEEYKAFESNYVLQEILNDNHDKFEPQANSGSFIKIYHLYIVIGMLVISGIFYLFNSDSNEIQGDIRIFAMLNKLSRLKSLNVASQNIFSLSRATCVLNEEVIQCAGRQHYHPNTAPDLMTARVPSSLMKVNVSSASTYFNGPSRVIEIIGADNLAILDASYGMLGHCNTTVKGLHNLQVSTRILFIK